MLFTIWPLTVVKQQDKNTITTSEKARNIHAPTPRVLKKSGMPSTLGLKTQVGIFSGY